MGILGNTVWGGAGLLAAAFTLAVYDYGFNEQHEIEKISNINITEWSHGIPPETTEIIRFVAKSGSEYFAVGGPPSGMFFNHAGADFKITYTGGILNSLTGLPRYPLQVERIAEPEPG